MSLHFLQKNQQCSTAVITTTGKFYESEINQPISQQLNLLLVAKEFQKETAAGILSFIMRL